MTNRRQVLKAGLGVVAAPISSASVLAAMPPGSSPHLVICDLRYEASVAFGCRARQSGASVRAIRSDTTQLWREELIPLWRAGNSIQLGLSGYDALFCLSMMARDWGFRPVYRMHHRPRADGRIMHEGIGHPIPWSLQRLQSNDWARHCADLLLERVRQPLTASNAAACSRAVLQSAGLCRDSLISWIMAPIGSAITPAPQMPTKPT